jgi:hypothetical protein
MSRALVLSLLLAACGGGQSDRYETTPTSVVVVETIQQTNPTVAPLPAHTLWQGRYLCAQGPTGLALTLDLSGDGRASAVFDFGAVPENPTVPTGRYLVLGSARPRGDGGLDLALAPDRWIAQPPGYVMVGLSAIIDAGARVLRGRIENPSCTGVELFRVQ